MVKVAILCYVTSTVSDLRYDDLSLSSAISIIVAKRPSYFPRHSKPRS